MARFAAWSSSIVGLLCLVAGCTHGPYRIEYSCGTSMPSGESFFRSLSLHTGTGELKMTKHNRVRRRQPNIPLPGDEAGIVRPEQPPVLESEESSQSLTVSRQRCAELAALAHAALKTAAPPPRHPVSEGASCTLLIFSPPEATTSSLSVIGPDGQDTAAGRLVAQLTPLLP